MTAKEFVSSLGDRAKPTANGAGWIVRCPAHEDKTPSLSVREGRDGKLLLHCHAGCEFDDILKAAGVSNGKPVVAPKSEPPQKRIVATYDYTDADGKLRYQVVRFEPKDFLQRRPDSTGKDGWRWDLRGVDRVLYRLPEVLGAVGARPVYVVEGEKDVETLRAAGFVATCNAGGAGKWKPEYSETLRGADVVVIPDKDAPGRKHAQQVQTALCGVAASVKAVELPGDGKDVSDWFAAGGSAADLDELVQAAEEQPGDTEETEVPQRLPAIIDAVNLVSEDFPEPVELVEGILHRGSKLALGGGSKSFKTWVLLDLALSVAYGAPWMGRATRQSKVLYVNLEIQPAFFARRLERVASAKAIEQTPGNLHVWNLRGHPAAFHELLDMIRDQGFDLIILDPIYKLYGLTDENKASDVARLLNGIEHLTVETAAAAVWGNHFSKGNQSGKESIDRISGSGVFARDPDSLLIMTRHEEEEAFTIEPTLRNFAPVQPFVVRWQFPLMVPAPDLDPGDLKKPGPKPKYDILELLGCIKETSPENPVSIRQWAENAKVARKTLDDYVTTMRERRWVGTVGEGQTARKYITPEGKNALV